LGGLPVKRGRYWRIQRPRDFSLASRSSRLRSAWYRRFGGRLTASSNPNSISQALTKVPSWVKT